MNTETELMLYTKPIGSTAKVNTCPHCDAKLNSYIFASDLFTPPEPGHITACNFCKKILIFNLDMSIRALNDDDEVLPEILEIIQQRATTKSKGFDNVSLCRGQPPTIVD